MIIIIYFSGQVWEHGGGQVPLPRRGQDRRQEQECNTVGRKGRTTKEQYLFFPLTTKFEALVIVPLLKK